MKPTTQKQITINEIAETLNAHSASDARERLSNFVGAQITAGGEVLKVSKRFSTRIVLKADSPLRPMEVIADFSSEEEIQKVKDAKLRQGAKILITGKFATAGQSALIITECRLVKADRD